jgi:hypothetical protein
MRRFTSLVLLVLFVLLAVTGVWMARDHHGPRLGPPAVTATASPESGAGAAGPGYRGPPFFPKRLHEAAGFALILAALLHLIFNYRTLLSHCGLRQQKKP